MEKMKNLFKVMSILLVLFILVSCDNPPQIKKVEVSFNYDQEIISVVEIDKDTKVLKPQAPDLEGFVFDDWYADASFNTKFDFNHVISETTYIYAKFIKEHTVKFVTNGTKVDDIIVLDGKLLDEPATTKELYIFEGWYQDSGFTTKFDFTQPIKADITLYANFLAPDFAALLEEAFLGLNIPNRTSQDLEFPRVGAYGTIFSYASYNLKYLSNKGNVNLAEYNTEGHAVNLTVNGSLDKIKMTKTFTIIIDSLTEEIVETSSTVEFESLAEEYIVAPGVIDVYYMLNGSIPYVDVASFLYLLDGAIDSLKDQPKEYTDDNGEVYYVVRYIDVIQNSPSNITVKYNAEYSQNDVVVEIETYEAVIDFEDNTLTTMNFDFFNALGASTETDFGEGLTYGNYTVFEGSPMVLDFNQYRMDLVTHVENSETLFLMPHALANLIFVGQVYYDTYFNGDKMFGFDSYQILDGSNVSQIIKESSKNTKTIPDDLKRFTYDYLAFTFDYFYGLKSLKTDTYYNYLDPFTDKLMHETDKSHYQAIFDIVYGLDDLHTYHQLTGYYEPQTYSISLDFDMLGRRTQEYYKNYWEVDGLVRSSNLGKSRVTADGSTGIVTIDSFEVETPDEFKKDVDSLLSQYPTIENIVIDITNNGGGNLGAVWRTLGYLTDEPIMYHSKNISDGSSYSQEIIDLYPAYNLNFYILTSPVTFSAANLMAATAKEMGIATIMGLSSSGGASSIGGIVTPTGDIFFMSSSSAMSTKNADGTLISVEYGITPNIRFKNLNQLYDDDYIQAVVNEN